ncbi:uncharacterized protein [Hoplias malabaricus]|uniref:uncharacterized protein n=1 Tax=Hoplias malabaricus TaxID=27720 RepID=UPI0034619371
MHEDYNMNYSISFPVFFLSFVGEVNAWFKNQSTTIQAVQLGDSVTIQCFLPKTDFNSMLWYKQELGRMPEPIAKCYNFLQDVQYMDGFKHERFLVSVSERYFHLSINAAKTEDTASYYCGVVSLNELRFGPGTFLIVKGERFKNQTILQNPVVGLHYPGDNVTLNCTVKLEELTCTEPHRVYWFKEKSGKTHSYLGSTEECKKGSETDYPTQSCVYQLHKTNLSLSDAGTYYCAVAVCGDVIYGNGTKLNVTDNNPPVAVRPTFLILISSNIISVLLMIIIIAIRCKNRSLSAGSSNCEMSLDTHGSHDEALNYAALSFNNKPSSSRGTRRQQKLKDIEVYSQVKHNQQS